MKKEEMIKCLTYLGIAYDKAYTQEECEVYYEFLKKHTYSALNEVVKEIIANEKFLPKLSEIIERLDKRKERQRYYILSKMKEDNYFKNNYEYDKAIAWMDEGIIPTWLKEDMNKYYEKQLTTNHVLIGE